MWGLRGQENCNFERIGARKLLRMGLVFARVWGGHAVCISPTERLKLRGQMAVDGGGSRQERISVAIPCLLRHMC